MPGDLEFDPAPAPIVQLRFLQLGDRVKLTLANGSAIVWAEITDYHGTPHGFRLTEPVDTLAGQTPVSVAMGDEVRFSGSQIHDVVES